MIRCQEQPISQICKIFLAKVRMIRIRFRHRRLVRIRHRSLRRLRKSLKTRKSGGKTTATVSSLLTKIEMKVWSLMIRTLMMIMYLLTLVTWLMDQKNKLLLTTFPLKIHRNQDQVHAAQKEILLERMRFLPSRRIIPCTTFSKVWIINQIKSIKEPFVQVINLEEAHINCTQSLAKRQETKDRSGCRVKKDLTRICRLWDYPRGNEIIWSTIFRSLRDLPRSSLKTPTSTKRQQKRNPSRRNWNSSRTSRRPMQLRNTPRVLHHLETSTIEQIQKYKRITKRFGQAVLRTQ